MIEYKIVRWNISFLYIFKMQKFKLILESVQTVEFNYILSFEISV